MAAPRRPGGTDPDAEQRLREAWAKVSSQFHQHWRLQLLALSVERSCLLVGRPPGDDWTLSLYLWEHGSLAKRGRLSAMEQDITTGAEPIRNLVLCDLQIFPTSYRGRGLGTWTLEQGILLARTRGCSLITGELSTVDERDGTLEHLIRFYRRAGFEVEPAPQREGWFTIALHLSSL